MTISAAEQYFIELTNRARLDPETEAARFGINLNDGLSAGTIDGSAKQVLAPNEALEDAAQAHSEWMLRTNTFSHTGEGGTNAGQRIQNAGYEFTGGGTWGENISWRGTSGTIDLEDAIESHYEGLFRSSGHRRNTLNDNFREIGIAQVAGDFTSGGRTLSTSMLTTKFAAAYSNSFVTGVAYSDLDGDEFYSIGEGRSGLTFSVGGRSDTTAAAGGYAVQVSTFGDVEVAISGSGVNARILVDTTQGNVKLDVVDRSLALVSQNATLISGINDAQLLGVAELELTGNGASNELTGNRSANVLDGKAGADVLRGLEGRDFLEGGSGSDTLFGGAGADTLSGGADDDVLYGGGSNDRLLGKLGDDLIFGGGGNDFAQGFLGADTLIGGDGRDTLGGGEGNDELRGGNGNDAIFGGDGNDHLIGWTGDDLLAGGADQDTLLGHVGNDTLRGENGNDRLIAGDGDDVLWGGSGDDFLFGNANNDVLHGNEGRDRLFGDAGADRLIGGVGNDTLAGGDGDDVFVFADNHGADVISDFDALSNGERLSFADVSAFTSTADVLSNHTTVVADGVLISDGAGVSILLLDVDLPDLGSQDFLFV